MVKVTIDNPERYWRETTRKLGNTVADGIRDIARITANAAASATFPRGTSGKVRDTLHKAIFKDISRAYAPAKSAPDDDGATYLLASRNAKGRVPSSTRRRPISFDSYHRMKRDLVHRAGMAKAGWVQAAGSLSSKTRIPVWLRKDASLGYSKVTPRSVLIANRVRYADTLLPPAQKRRIMANAYAGYWKRAQRI